MSKIKMLVVDDELGIREGAKRVLQNLRVDLPYIEDTYSLDVTTAESGEKALALLNQDDYDLALLDNRLPGIQGTEILEYISRQDRDMLAIMVTAYASVETAVAATKTGAYDILVKPFTPSELESAVFKAAKHLILTRLTKKLTQEKHQIRFEFISILAHELKGPLNAVSGYLQMMSQKAEGDLVESYEPMIQRSLSRIDRMKKLILDLLDLSKIESGQQKRLLEKVNIVDLVRSAIEQQKSRCSQNNISLELIAPEQAWFLCDAMEIEMVLNNLISNAVKYNKEKGRVTVTLKQEDNILEIDVADTGIGITEEEKINLFKEFSRIKNQETKNIEGSGLGLSIVKKIVNLYHGWIQVDSTPGAGTVFSIILRETRASESM